MINILLNVYSPKRMWTRSWSSSGLPALRGLRKTHFPICSSLVKRISSKALAYDPASLACTLRRLCPLYCVGRGMIHGHIHMWSYMYMAIGNVCRRLQAILSQHKKQSHLFTYNVLFIVHYILLRTKQKQTYECNASPRSVCTLEHTYHIYMNIMLTDTLVPPFTMLIKRWCIIFSRLFIPSTVLLRSCICRIPIIMLP